MKTPNPHLYYRFMWSITIHILLHYSDVRLLSVSSFVRYLKPILLLSATYSFSVTLLVMRFEVMQYIALRYYFILCRAMPVLLKHVCLNGALRQCSMIRSTTYFSLAFHSWALDRTFQASPSAVLATLSCLYYRRLLPWLRVYGIESTLCFSVRHRR